MWLIISSNNPDETTCLLVGKEYIVGRRPEDSDMAILKDQSVSRKHATLTVSHSEANLGHPHKPSILTVKDLSKFGTYLNGVRLQKEQCHIVKDGDSIKFGSQQSIYRIKHEPLLMTTSCLDTNSKKGVKTLACKLGAHIFNEWRKDCSLLIMSRLSVTVKVICALVSQCPVVTPEYLEEMHKCLKTGDSIPNPKNFLPPLAETQLNPEKVSFNTNPIRSTLFQNKRFIFLSPKQFKKLSLSVELAGGTPVLMEEGTDDNNDSILTGQDTCVMQTEVQDKTQTMSLNAHQWMKYVMQYLKNHGKRPIQDAEIGYAVLYCSTDNYCNPDTEPGEHLNMSDPKLPSQSCSSQIIDTQNATVLTKDTQLSQIPQRPKHPNSTFNCTTTTVPNSEESFKLNESSFPAVNVLKEEPVSQEVPVQPPNYKKRTRQGDAHDGPSSKIPRQNSPTPQQVTYKKVQYPRTTDDSTNSPRNIKNQRKDSSMMSNAKPKPFIKQEIAVNHGVITSKENGDNAVELNQVTKTGNANNQNAKNEPQKAETKDSNSCIMLPRNESAGQHQSFKKLGGKEKCQSNQTDDNSGQDRLIMNRGGNSSLTGSNKNVPEGFLTKPIQDQVDQHYRYEQDDQLPTKLLTAEIVSGLIVRKPDMSKSHQTTLTAGTCMWNGKIIKNFKKFHKAVNVEASNFPQIIGGADLVEYVSKAGSADMEQFLVSETSNVPNNISSQASQESRLEANSVEDDLFD